MNIPHALLVLAESQDGFQAEDHRFARALHAAMEDQFGEDSFGLQVVHASTIKRDNLINIGVLVVYGDRGEDFYPATYPCFGDAKGKVLIYPAKSGPIGVIRANRALSGAIHYQLEDGDASIAARIAMYVASLVQPTAV